MLKAIVKSSSAYFGTLKLISKLGLWKYFGVPIAISVCTMFIIGLTAYSLSDNLGSLIATLWLWEWGSQSFLFLSEIVSGLIIITVGFIIYKHIVLALSAPFMGPVSEKIERHLLGCPKNNTISNSFSELLWRGIRINIRNLSFEILLSLPFIILGFIPIVNVFSAVVLFLIQSYYAGFGNMDYTLERHLSYNNSIRFVKQNKGIAIGNGMVFMLFLMIPIVGIILVLPLSVTAASIVTVDKLQTNKTLQNYEP